MNVLIIEDDQRVAELIQRGLDEQGFTTTVARDGIAGKKQALLSDFDVIITDIMLPYLNGLELCKQIRQAKPNMPIIMLTALGTTDDKIDGLDSGADDYLVKPFDFRELLARIRAVTKRSNNLLAKPAELLRLADLELNPTTLQVIRAGKEINLTPKEFKLLAYMMQHAGRVLSRAEIAEKVWDTTFDTGTNFIDVYINYLRKKIDKDYTVKLIHTKPGIGFIFKEA
jgi:DNA-binding response OmpR family regulator